MSMHKIPLTPLEEEGLRLHGLPVGTPSQTSDTFRQGVAWALQSSPQAPAVPTDEQIHAAYRNALGQSIRERDMPEIRKFARALLQSAPQASAVQLVDGSDDYYDYLGALVEQHPAGVMRRNTDDKAPAVPDDTAILDWLEMQRVDVASVVGHRPQYGFLSVGASGKSDLRSKVIALLQSEVRHD